MFHQVPGKLKLFICVCNNANMWPTETFAQARVDVKPMSISFTCISSRNKSMIAAVSSARLQFSAFR